MSRPVSNSDHTLRGKYCRGFRRKSTYPSVQKKILIFLQVYNVPDALQPEAPADPSVFLNGQLVTQNVNGGLTIQAVDNRTRAAIHAPTSKDWEESILYPFGQNCVVLYSMVCLSNAFFSGSSNDNIFADPSNSLPALSRGSILI